MGHTLDIAPLRSLVAVADCGGFQRAATSLHLSQAAVSQHVRRLEAVTGRTLVERAGRGSRLTPDGERLLAQARRLLAIHDETLREFGRGAERSVVIGSTEHAAAQLLPHLAAALERSLPDHAIRFRLDRGSQLRERLDGGGVDLALLLGPADDPRAIHIGELELVWYSSPLWQRPAGPDPVPVVAFDHPCALRTRALETLSAHAIPAVIGAEAIQLAGVQAAVGAGLGVALMATLSQTPEGLVARDDLPAPRPLPLAVWSRQGLAETISWRVAEALRGLLAERAAPGPAAADLDPAPKLNRVPTTELAKGA
ncbi:LysR family transcriptional regulator [Frankia sp. AgB32]|uniref:LysR family transcriptional regulator n=1 Tax=Frankia sp. AgB32 TaxID=631119 RepID=UPI00200FFA7E|nr:LysR family transcriptional regulator [Frankia sp. AgB32]MCK9895936.1 LysR family transcriptional regulator [Frankia sp. AgB32]